MEAQTFFLPTQPLQQLCPAPTTATSDAWLLCVEQSSGSSSYMAGSLHGRGQVYCHCWRIAWRGRSAAFIAWSFPMRVCWQARRKGSPRRAGTMDCPDGLRSFICKQRRTQLTDFWLCSCRFGLSLALFEVSTPSLKAIRAIESLPAQTLSSIFRFRFPQVRICFSTASRCT